MNVRKPVDYGTMHRELTAILAQNLPQMDEIHAIGKVISQRPEKGAAVAAAEFLQANFPDRTGFSPRNVRRMRDFYKTYENDQTLLRLAMKIGWTLNVVIMEAELTREQRSPCLQRAAPEQPPKKKLLEIILNGAFAEKPIDEPDEICYNITNSGEGRNDQAQFESPLHRVAEGKRGALRCGRRKISLSVFCCYSLESAFRRVFTAAGMPLYGAALYDLDWRFSSENAFRVGKAVRLCIENKTVAERITRAEAAQLLHAVQPQTLTATSFDTLVAVENLMQWNVNTFLLELQKILQFNTMK